MRYTPTFRFPKTISPEEQKELLAYYGQLQQTYMIYTSKADATKIHEAFQLAIEAHGDTRRQSGEPYIIHPLRVALIVANDIGLGPISIMAALLHDVVEDTDVSLNKIKTKFGTRVARVVEGLTKIKVTGIHTSLQTQNYGKILRTFSQDSRIIFIKIADRLDNMGDLDKVSERQRLKIASETHFFYIPLAHRLGLNKIKQTLENLFLQYSQPHVYQRLTTQLEAVKGQHQRVISAFFKPIEHLLKEEEIKFRITQRVKSIYSIWQKMKHRKIPLQDIYDLVALRIIIDAPPKEEKTICWRIYTLITGLYTPHPGRLRDWVSMPQSNGYESLHATLMSNQGTWVEVQIRTERMHESATRGVAAHWRYKEDKLKLKIPHLEQWIKEVQELISQDQSISAIETVTQSLQEPEIRIFSERGKVYRLPRGATVLDFAITHLGKEGLHTTYALVNKKQQPLDTKLKNGEQVKVVLSQQQQPKEKWLSFTITSKARQVISQALAEHRATHKAEGLAKVRKALKPFKMRLTAGLLQALQAFFQEPDADAFYAKVATGHVVLSKALAEIKQTRKDNPMVLFKARDKVAPATYVTKSEGDDSTQKLDQGTYSLPPCCSPMIGEDVILVKLPQQHLVLHSLKCKEATKLLATHSRYITKGRWLHQAMDFLVTLEVEAVDSKGLTRKILEKIDSFNIENLTFYKVGSRMKGKIVVHISDNLVLRQLQEAIKSVEEVTNVQRVDTKAVVT